MQTNKFPEPYHVGSIDSKLHIVDTLTLSTLKKDLDILLFVK